MDDKRMTERKMETGTKQEISIDGQEVSISTTRKGNVFEVAQPEGRSTVEVRAIVGNEAQLVVNGRSIQVPFLRVGNQIQFLYDGEHYVVEVSEGATPARKRSRQQSMAAPMPGVVLKIFAGIGDVVTKGSTLLILEAMKMEHPITATYDGTVRALHCKAGDLVQPGVELIEIQPKESR